MKIAIIDYNLGNTYSVANAIKYLGYDVEISSDEKKIKNADLLILPGVGAFEEAIKNLQLLNLNNILDEEVIVNKKKILGICVGMQLFAKTSDEKGNHKGLGWIDGNVKKIIPNNLDKVPHVGWNNINYEKTSILFSRIGDMNNFYFDHGFHFDCEDKYKSSFCKYGDIKITSSVEKENIFGVQFHPEKSQNAGLKLFKGFIEAIK